MVLIELEDLGFCKKGEAGAFVEAGETALDGSLPMNTHGGLLSHCHPGNPGSMFALTEAVTQLRHDAGARQVENCGSCAGTCPGRHHVEPCNPDSWPRERRMTEAPLKHFPRPTPETEAYWEDAASTNCCCSVARNAASSSSTHVSSVRTARARTWNGLRAAGEAGTNIRYRSPRGFRGIRCRCSLCRRVDTA